MDGSGARSRSDLAQQAMEIAAAGLGGTVGLVGGLPGAVLGAAGSQLAVAVAGAVWAAYNTRRQYRAAVPLTYVALAQDCDIQEVQRRIESDPELTDLAGRCMLAAAETSLDAKLVALGRVLNNVLEDKATLDLDGLVAEALGAVEPPHLKVLAYLDSHYQSDNGRHVNVYGVHGALPELGLGVRPILSTLQSRSMVYEEVGYGEVSRRNPRTPWLDVKPEIRILRNSWGITEFGHEILARLRQAADDLTQDVGDGATEHRA